MLQKKIEYSSTDMIIGDWSFSSDDKDMFLVYPSPSIIEGEKVPDLVHLPIHQAGMTDDRSPSWEWNGDRENPTLHPSINVIGKWHGYLRDGKLETA